MPFDEELKSMQATANVRRPLALRSTCGRVTTFKENFAEARDENND